ncbi:MAG: hypothetical protein AB7O45_08175 [Alphaproteobacteria bacterium]
MKHEPAPRRVSHVLSADLGRMNDFTALSVIRRVDAGDDSWYFDPRRPDVSIEGRTVEFQVPHLSRLPLMLSYVHQVERIGELYVRLKAIDHNAALVIDATGVGNAVCDLFVAAGLPVIAITLTAGAEPEYKGGGRWSLPKRVAVQRLEAALHTGELRIADGLPEGEVLRRELRDFRARYTSTGLLTFSHRDGAHDDLVLSLALGLWFSARPESNARTFKLKGL